MATPGSPIRQMWMFPGKCKGSLSDPSTQVVNPEGRRAFETWTPSQSPYCIKDKHSAKSLTLSCYSQTHGILTFPPSQITLPSNASCPPTSYLHALRRLVHVTCSNSAFPHIFMTVDLRSNKSSLLFIDIVLCNLLQLLCAQLSGPITSSSLSVIFTIRWASM